jgi:hypothetical protein
MKILFDQGTPVPLRRYLHPRSVDTAAELGWGELANGDLLAASEQAGFEILITTDQNLRYQQNLSQRTIGIVVLMSTSWPRIRQRIQDILAVVDSLPPGGYAEVKIDRTKRHS